MKYSLVLKEEADNDLLDLSHNQRNLVFKQFKKLQTSPELGLPLGNKLGYDLVGYRKMYVDKKKLRIIYTIKQKEIIVEVIAISKRDNMEAYRKTFERI